METLKIVTTLILATFFFTAQAGGPGSGQLNVELDGITASSGNVKVVLFNQALGFPGEHDMSFLTLTIDLSDPQAATYFQSIPFGTYAIVAYHDADNDGKLDKKFGGKYLEQHAFTNITGKVSKVKFDQSSFQFNEAGQTIALTFDSPCEKQKQGAVTPTLAAE